MPFISHPLKEIHFKILYWGPEGGGKRSSLQKIFALSQPEKASLFPLGENLELLIVRAGRILGFQTFFHALAARREGGSEAPPGAALARSASEAKAEAAEARGVAEAESEALLSHIDGLIFVADSRPQAQEANRRSFERLQKQLQRRSQDIFRIPMALQYNKRDLPERMPIRTLRADLNRCNSQDFESSLPLNFGFMKPFKHICREALLTLKAGEIP